MKPKVLSNHLYSAFYAVLLSVALPVCAEESKGTEIHLSELELREIFDNPMRSYVYVGREVSNIAEVMEEISKLEDNPTSLIHGLVDHIKRGFNIGNYDAVAQALEEAEGLLIKHNDSLDEEKATWLTRSLDTIIEQVIEERLNLDAEILSFLKDSVAKDDTVKSCCKPKPHCHGLRLLVVKEKMDILGKAKFRNDVTFKDDVVFEDDVTFEDAVTFAEGITSEGTLSVTDVAIGCDLTVGCNINMNNSVSAAIGNIEKAGAPFIHNFGTNNTFMGINAGNFTLSGPGNTAMGVNTLSSNATGSTNIAIGLNALFNNTTGFSNVAVGVNSLISNTTGSRNVAMGANSLQFNTIGIDNTALGDSALRDNVLGNTNVAVGAGALLRSTSDNNIALGNAAGSLLTTGNNNIYIAANAAVGTESTTTRIGTAQTRCFVAGVRGVVTGIANAIPVLIDSAGQLGTISSSIQFKHNVQDMANASSNIYDLRPVTFEYNWDETNKTQYGLIAEEVDQVFPELVIYENDQPNTVAYHMLPVLLLNELQKLAARVVALEEMLN